MESIAYPKSVLITGASGFLGTRLIEELIARSDSKIYALVRPRSVQSARERMERLWAAKSALIDELGNRIEIVEGDVAKPLFGLEEAACAELAANVSAIIHTAADVRINRLEKALRIANVESTLNALDFAELAQSKGGLSRFVHISTAYVAGRLFGRIPEAPLDVDSYSSLYERTKHEAEKFVLKRADKLPIAIIRPGQIIGDSKTGEVPRFNTIYYPMKLYLEGKLKAVPIDPDQHMNIVPVDYVAEGVLKALVADEPSGKIYHMLIPQEKQPTVSEIIEFVRIWAQENLRIELSSPKYIKPPLLESAGVRSNLKGKREKRSSALNNMLALAPYFYDSHSFDTTNAEQLLGQCELEWREFAPNILSYATTRGFLNLTGRTVFEQMQVRLSSKRNKITYHDVSADGIRTTKPKEMLERIRAIAAGLLAVGIQPLDRIALVGVNSSEYTAVDAAIGLIGATSVPLYFTSPYEDICELSRRGKCKIIFIGMDAIAEHATDGALRMPVILMGQTKMPEGAGDTITDWDTFLEIGRAHMDLLESCPAARFTDIETIRYTSGTTGQPKGVTFTQQQLEWMGRTMPAILDWETRNSEIRYLSFLPMSHVVEGILVAYAPFFALTDVDIYCLNDFSMLTEALPKVRPTMFFSVPRFYEKLWNQFIATSAGKRWLSMKDGPAKRAFGKICKRTLLKKAGLDTCRQLIVGSAPIRLDLLESFRELGIEIHNAFGLTEAPLITLNRLGSNDLGSLGQPLPETEVDIDESGEILMRGPQVTCHFDGIEESVLDENGWFKTGDLGHWSEAGNLVIEGRRKGLVVTSYGKNVQPEKIEAMIKGVPGVSEAMLIGDSLPYCTAFAWLEEEAAESFDAQIFDEAMREMNSHLSHPEQVKRWAVLKRNPSLSAGELTPNLKLRRKVILEHEAAAVEALYAENIGEVPGALHVGVAK